MQFEDYQKLSRDTKVYLEKDSITYPALGLCGEAGEVANQVKKMFRDDKGELTMDRSLKIIDELGDCLWYISALCEDMRVSLEYVARHNLLKLNERMKNGEIHGDQREK